jgi:uncharacterized membrane protein YeaQ/YmgE (transglycosylase-associated protein family)
LAGPLDRKASRKSGVESRNDRNLILMMFLLGAVGAFYGVETGSSWTGEMIGAALYGFVGVVAGVPIALAVNITRNWR